MTQKTHPTWLAANAVRSRPVGAVDYVASAHALRAQAMADLFVSLGSTLRAAARRLRAQFTDWSRRRHTFRELARLDDRTLADIGLTRYDVQAMALGFKPVPERHTNVELPTGPLAPIVEFAPTPSRDRLAAAFQRLEKSTAIKDQRAA